MSTQQSTADVTAAGLSQVDQNINNTDEDRSHEARGHKANLSNPSESLFVKTARPIAKPLYK